MRKRKVSSLVLLAIATFIIYFISHCSYYSNVENAYPAIYEAYEVCKENTEKLYALMLDYDRNVGLEEAIYRDSDLDTWPEETREVLLTLKNDLDALLGEGNRHYMLFEKNDIGDWYVCIHIGNLYSHHISLYYSPFGRLPRYYCERLEGLDFYWSYSARMYY